MTSGFTSPETDIFAKFGDSNSSNSISENDTEDIFSTTHSYTSQSPATITQKNGNNNEFENNSEINDFNMFGCITEEDDGHLANSFDFMAASPDMEPEIVSEESNSAPILNLDSISNMHEIENNDNTTAMQNSDIIDDECLDEIDLNV